MLWNKNTTYGTDIEYRCSAYATFQSPASEDGLVPAEDYDILQISCQWNKTWTTDELDPCIWTHCNVIPEPPEETGLLYREDNDFGLKLQSQYASYEPEVPANLPVPHEFGANTEVNDTILNGLLSTHPTLFFKDGAGKSQPPYLLMLLNA